MIMGCDNASGISDTTKTATSTVQRNIIFGRRLERRIRMAHLEKMFPERPTRVKYFLRKYQKYVWYQDDISLSDYRLVNPFQFVATVIEELK